MKKKHKKKEIKHHFRVDVREDIHLEWDSKQDCPLLLNSEGGISEKSLVSIVNKYDRPGKQSKVLRQIPNPRGAILKFYNELNAFDQYWAVDTSYKPLGNRFLCSTALIRLTEDLQGRSGFKKGEPISIVIPPQLIFLAALNTKPERYGWMKIVDALLNWELYDKDCSYALIVDSELDDLARFNAKEIPINANVFVPTNVTLLYASADVGADVLINKLIRIADRVAREALDAAFEYYKGKEFAFPLFSQDYLDVSLWNTDIEI